MERFAAEAGPSSEKGRWRPGPWPPSIEPFVPVTDHNPRELKSWAKRTGFNPNFSGETNLSSIIDDGEGDAAPPPPPGREVGLDLGKGLGWRRGNAGNSRVEMEPIFGRRRAGTEINPVTDPEPVALKDVGRREVKEKRRIDGIGPKVDLKGEVEERGARNETPVRAKNEWMNSNKKGYGEPPLARAGDGEPQKDVGRREVKEKRRVDGIEPEVDLKEEVEERGARNETPVRAKNEGMNGNKKGNGEPPLARAGDGEPPLARAGDGEPRKDEVEIDLFLDAQELQNPPPYKSGLKCDLMENLGFGRLFFYGIQHYLSLTGSLVFIPLIMVPAMGGTDGETANVISTMLLVSGVTTIMHSFFGTRLPLVQGSSFVYLAPALIISNSTEYRNLSENKFKHTMRELQGAIIIGSIFQTVLGYSGLMSLILRLINPVVVAPTIAAVGLAFFSYGFPQAGSCAGISIPLILLILIFTLYLRKISIFGHRVFLVYAVPLSVAIVWAYAFFLTAGGAYNYKGCSPNIPSPNILSDTCRKHALTMKRCRTDVSGALKAAAWVRIPYPYQWGTPTFSFRTSIIMIIVSIIASVDSIGSYHTTSLLISLRPPTPGVVSRGIGLEGFSSILAGLWGTGTGSTTLTENVHTLEVTKMASRKALAFGAVFLILFSFVGKVGALLASIPLALAAAVLCFTWALIVALGLSTMQYTQTASSRNILIVGFTLFISLSIPAYFQQYPPNSTLVLPSYLVPYAAASDGPINIGNKGLNYALNSLLSLNMVVALLVAFVLDNTVPGSRQERGAYIWSSLRNPDIDASSMRPYLLPVKVGRLFRWAKWVGS